MRFDYDTLGEYIRLVDERNADAQANTLLGVSINKYFMPSVANVIGTDLTKYKVIRKMQFACSLMQVSRDEKIPIDCLTSYEIAMVSPAYHVFEVIDTDTLMPEYLAMWFKRAEFDREASFLGVGGVRGSMTWDDFCGMRLPVPPIEKQREVVTAYKVITDRIALKRELNDNLLAALQAVYQERFVQHISADILPVEWERRPLGELCSKIGSGATPTGGKASYFAAGITLIRSTNVFDYLFSYEGLAHISDEQAATLNNVTVQEYDVLFNITGVSVARCCIVPPNVLPARVNQHVMIVRPYDGEFMSYYLLCVLCANENKQKLLGIGQSGSTREAINQQELRNFEVIKPPASVLELFGVAVAPLYRQITENLLEVQSLIDLQGVLLAKLSA